MKQEDARFAEFLADAGLKPFEQMVAADELASYDLVEKYAEWLADVYKIKTGQRAGKGYMAQTAVNKINDRMLAIKKRLLLLGLHNDHKEGEHVRRFLTAMEPHARSDSYAWLVGVRHKMAREIFERMKISGERVDMSQEPVYPLHVQAMCKAYEAAGTSEAWTRRFAIAATGLSAGRASEAAWLNTDRCEPCSRSPTGCPMSLLLAPYLPVPADTPPTRFPNSSYCSLSWDDNFSCVYAKCMQQKTSKSAPPTFCRSGPMRTP